MKKIPVIFLFILYCFLSISNSQILKEPKLVGSWIKGEDYGEFIFHKVDELKYYLEENKSGRIVARICSKFEFPLALVSSNGSAYQILAYTRIHQIPDQKVFFALSSKCRDKSEQFWFVPEDTNIEYDEIFSAEKVSVVRLIEEYAENPDDPISKEQFTANSERFISELEKDSNAHGFIVLNVETKNRHYREVMDLIRKRNLDKSRFQVVRKSNYHTHFPEFIIVSIEN